VGEALQLAVLPLGFLLILYARRKWPVYICSEGLLLKWRKKTEAVRWDEIEEVYWRSPKDILLQKADSKQTWNLKHLEKGREILAIIEREVVPRLLARAREQYAELDMVSFGCLSISEAGIANNSPAVSWSQAERVIHWQDLEDIRFLGGVLSIKTQGLWKRWDGGPRAQKRPASAIPNPMVYAAVARHLLLIANEGISEASSTE
jgi:hypothetical protein